MEIGLYIVIAAIVAGGFVGAAVRTWAILSRLYSLENEVAVIQRTLTSEVKRRASEERWKRKEPDVAELAQLQQAMSGGMPSQNKNVPWWTRYGSPTAKQMPNGNV